MRRERRKNFFNPKTMLHLEYSLRTEKKTPQHKSTYTINTWHCNRGNISSSGKQPSGPVPFISAPVADLLALVAVQSVTEAVEWGRGVMSVVGEGRERVPLHRSLRVVIQTALAKAPVRGARKDKIKLLWLWGEQLQTTAAHSLCPFWSLKSFTSKAASFIMMVSIFRFIVSVSLLTALPTASIKTGSLVRLWTAVPVFWIFR